jgi:hypothetical protein
MRHKATGHIRTDLQTHACHPKCVAAHGPICECRCHGDNHGLIAQLQPRLAGLDQPAQQEQEAQPCTTDQDYTTAYGSAET